MVGDDRCWLWLEDVDGIPAPRWKRHRFLEAAQHLGEFQGAFLAGHCKLPNHEWFYRSFIESSAPAYRAELLSRFDDGALWADPLTQRTIDRSVWKMAKRVWQHHEVLVQTVRRLPKTLCHWDVASQNLLAADQLTPTTVLLDWGTVGLGPAGADLSILVGTSLCNELGPRDLDELESELLSAYLLGLREAGWDGHEGEVTFAYRVFAALHFGILIGLLMSKFLNLDWRKRKAQERGQPIERIVGDQVAFMARTLEGVVPYLPN